MSALPPPFKGTTSTTGVAATPSTDDDFEYIATAVVEGPLHTHPCRPLLPVTDDDETDETQGWSEA